VLVTASRKDALDPFRRPVPHVVGVRDHAGARSKSLSQDRTKQKICLPGQVEGDDGRLSEVGGQGVMLPESREVRHPFLLRALPGEPQEKRVDLYSDTPRSIRFAAIITMRPSPEPRS
jgi:hypothetical protein